MYNMKTHTKLFTATTLLLLLGACSGDNEAFEPAGSNILPPTNIADANSFTLGRTIANLEALTRNGVENEITARVADRHNNPAPDGTVVQFLTNGGSIPSQCKTTDGACTVTWISQNPRPGVNGNPGQPGVVVVLAYTTGEESFNDLNDNDQFDAGETIADLPEPFLDVNLDGTRNANEEFVDFNGNNTFDLADGVYTGTSCVGDNTVCNRTNLFVWQTSSFLITGLPTNISYAPNPLQFSTDAAGTITVTITDTNTNPLASGTQINIKVADGSIEPTAITATGGDTTFVLTYTAPSAPGADTLSLEIISPVSEIKTNDSAIITIN